VLINKQKAVTRMAKELGMSISLVPVS